VNCDRSAGQYAAAIFVSTGHARPPAASNLEKEISMKAKLARLATAAALAAAFAGAASAQTAAPRDPVAAAALAVLGQALQTIGQHVQGRAQEPVPQAGQYPAQYPTQYPNQYPGSQYPGQYPNQPSYPARNAHDYPPR